ncbi:hypothetical protein ROA7450_02916 [Roseovarius albus]|uniref:DUF4350 domain-containing protein n=1 Tax=Roseovarius albus TaxID=1247867 RepID=A0A1X6ZMT6_9RHOB|nr:hypothetical protein [Roseovarius albus]SLN56331.1 hypothetical protein ROA7450_02916 [Roseovarius albus]
MAEAIGKARDGGAGVMPVVIIVVLLLGGLFLMTQLSLAARDRALDRSAIGMAGLSGWLVQNEVPARLAHSRIHPALEDLSLRVLPLYDLDLESYARDPETTEELLNRTDLRDLELETFETKIVEMPTVVLLPKWRGAAAELKFLHEQMLIPPKAQQSLLGQIGLAGVRLQQDGAEMSSIREGDSEVALFHMQTFVAATLPRDCTPILTAGGDPLAIRCVREEEYPIYFVADPDLLNNHGLGLADNAAFAVSLLQDLRGETEAPIYIDISPDLLTTVDRSEERQDYERGGEELSRFLQYPFSMFWAVFLIVAGVTYWRGALRFGPVARGDDRAWDQSKEAAIAAKARILRLSGNDGAMVADFVAAQLRTLSTDVLGHDQPDDGGQRFFRVLARRDKQLAHDLSSVAEVLITQATRMSPRDLDRNLNNYHSLLKKVVEPNGSI